MRPIFEQCIPKYKTLKEFSDRFDFLDYELVEETIDIRVRKLLGKFNLDSFDLMFKQFTDIIYPKISGGYPSIYSGAFVSGAVPTKFSHDFYTKSDTLYGNQTDVTTVDEAVKIDYSETESRIILNQIYQKDYHESKETN